MIQENATVRLANGTIVQLRTDEIQNPCFRDGWERAERCLGTLHLRGAALIGWHSQKDAPLALHVDENMVHVAFQSLKVRLTGISQAEVAGKRLSIERGVELQRNRSDRPDFLERARSRLEKLQRICLHPCGVPCKECGKQ